MRLSLHPRVQHDVNAILRRYDEVSDGLGDRFFRELTDALKVVLENPQKGHSVARGLRRYNLPSFPFHFLFRIVGDRVRVTVVRHHKRHPRTGTTRR